MTMNEAFLNGENTFFTSVEATRYVADWWPTEEVFGNPPFNG